MPLIARLGGGRRLGRLAGAYSLMLLGCVLIVPDEDAGADDITRRGLGGVFLILLGMQLHPGSLDEPGIPAPLQQSLVGGMVRDLYQPSPNLLWSLRYVLGGGGVAWALRRDVGPYFLLRYFAGGLGLLPAMTHRAWARSRAPAPFGMPLQRADLPPQLFNFFCGLLLECSAVMVQISNSWLLSRHVSGVMNLPPTMLTPSPHWRHVWRLLAPVVAGNLADHGARMLFMFCEPDSDPIHNNAGNMAWVLTRFTTRFFAAGSRQDGVEQAYMLLFDVLQLQMRDHRRHFLRVGHPAYPIGFATMPLAWQRELPGRAAAQLAMQLEGYFPPAGDLAVWPSPSVSPAPGSPGGSRGSSRSASPAPAPVPAPLTPPMAPQLPPQLPPQVQMAALVLAQLELPRGPLAPYASEQRFSPVASRSPSHSRSPSRDEEDGKSEGRPLLPPR